MKIAVLDSATLYFPNSEWDFLKKFGEVVLHNATSVHDENLIVERCSGCEIVLTNKVPLTLRMMERLPALKYVGVLATGYNVIDTAAAKQRGVVVTNVPSYSTSSVVQHTIALILELCDHVGRHDEMVREGQWQRSELFCFWETPIQELEGLTVAVVGLGTIGRKVAEILGGFGCKIVGVGRARREEPKVDDFRWVSLEDALGMADIVTLHCPQTDLTRNMINAETLKHMKSSAFLINTARGGLIDEAALAAALRQKTIAGAGLDVLTVEPMAQDCPLMGVPNCIITPHMAWGSTASRKRLMKIVGDNISAFLAGKPRNVVNV